MPSKEFIVECLNNLSKMKNRSLAKEIILDDCDPNVRELVFWIVDKITESRAEDAGIDPKVCDNCGSVYIDV